MVRLVKTETSPAPKPDQPETPATPRRSRRWVRVPLLALFALFFVGSGWFSYKVAAATNRIFTDNVGGGSPILQGKKAENEDQSKINILLLGTGGEGHDGPNLADTIQLVSVDPKAKQISMLSLPRDLWVTAPGSGGQKMKINAVNDFGETNNVEGGGGALMKQMVKDITGLDVHYYVRIDFEGFKQAVDSVGGVDINVSERLYDPFYPRGTGYEVLNIPPGQTHMNGELALKYARSRETTTDFDRSRRQQEVMMALREKALSLQYLTNPGKISGVLDILGNRLKTDLSLGETQRLAKIVRDIPSTAVTSKVIDNSNLLYDTTGPGGAYILLPKAGDYSDIRAFASELVNGAELRGEAAKLEVLNASGRSGVAAQEAADLTEAGMTITGTANAPESAVPTIIYAYTDKPATLAFLQKRYGGQVVKQQGAVTNLDFRVVIGSSYTTTPTTTSVNQRLR